MTNYTILSFDELTSTSDLLKEHFSSFSHFTMIKTNYQTKGRGQFDRTWISNKNENLLFSILLKDLSVNDIEYLKDWIVNGLFKLLTDYQMQPVFKEPNDIYVNDKKICGILFETRTQNDQLVYAVIGIGLNVCQTEFNELNATSMHNVLNQQLKTDEVFDKLVKILLTSYQVQKKML